MSVIKHCLFLVLLLIHSGFAAGDVREDQLRAGIAAMGRQHYATAMRAWYDLAEAGDAEAQNNIGSLVLSSIKPVIDFGWMMSIGLLVTFLVSFLFFPTAAAVLQKPAVTATRQSPGTWVTGWLSPPHIDAGENRGPPTPSLFFAA